MKEQIFKHSINFVIVPAVILEIGTLALFCLGAPVSYKLMSAVLSAAFIAGGIIIYFIKKGKIDRGDYCSYKGVVNSITLRSYRSFVFEVSVRLENGDDISVYVIGLNRFTLKKGLACEVIDYGHILGLNILRDELIMSEVENTRSRFEKNAYKCVVCIALFISAIFILLNNHKLTYKLTYNGPELSTKTLFTLRSDQPWCYEDNHYTLLADGTLITELGGREIGRMQVSDECMSAINEAFDPKYIYMMDVGEEDGMTDGTSKYIILYDVNENQICIGGYELRGGDDFRGLYSKLYEILDDEFKK